MFRRILEVITISSNSSISALYGSRMPGLTTIAILATATWFATLAVPSSAAAAAVAVAAASVSLSASASSSVNCTKLNVASYVDKPIAEILAATNPATLCPEDAKTHALLRQQLQNERQVHVVSTLRSQITQALDPQRTSSTESSNETVLEDIARTRKDNELIPVYCGVMGLIIISSVLYAILKQRKQRIRKKKAKSVASLSKVITNPAVSNLSKPTKVHNSPSLPSSTDVDARQVAEPLLIRAARPLDWRSDVDSSFISDKAILTLCCALEKEPLDGDGSCWWKKLAAALNFGESEVLSAEYQTVSTGFHPLYILLSQSVRLPEFRLTQTVLCEALVRIGKSQLCSLLQLSLSATAN